MKVWHFTEMPYPHIPEEDTYASVRVSLPNSIYDPQIGAELYNRYLDEWVLADELGLNIMTNEHHQTPTSIDVACPLTLAILARETKSARLLALGNPIANRGNPIRVAEEMAMIDNISRGRLEVGFVRGVPYEIAPSNANPVRQADRLWEAHDLIIKAWTSTEGPFRWEGKYFHNRQVNVWPRPYQQPHPPVWITASSPENARRTAENGHVVATFLSGFDGAKTLFDSYRAAYEEYRGDGHEAPADRFGYLALAYVGETDELGLRGARALLWYLTTNKIAPQFANPPGYRSVAANVQALKGEQRRPPLNDMPVEDLIERGLLFAGNPESVFKQIKRFNDHVGGLGNLMIMGQAGFLSHEDTVSNLSLFAKEVYPRLKELNPAASSLGARQE